jgi:hypothetical protein
MNAPDQDSQDNKEAGEREKSEQQAFEYLYG